MLTLLLLLLAICNCLHKTHLELGCTRGDER